MRKIQVGDLRISLDDVGMGEPVVLIHGLACGKRMWFHQIRALRERFRVIAYDQRGHGLTDAPADPKHYSPSHLVRDLSGLLDALGIARPRSSGSRWAAALHLAWPRARRIASPGSCSPMSALAPTTCGSRNG
jgi:pimeloyl-ACP methyl ester carboxylesterase